MNFILTGEQWPCLDKILEILKQVWLMNYFTKQPENLSLSIKKAGNPAFYLAGQLFFIGKQFSANRQQNEPMVLILS